MVEIAAAVEHHVGDAGLERPLGDELANGLRRFEVAALLERALQILDEAGLDEAAPSSRVADDSAPYGLSIREQEVLRHLADGLADKQIASELGLSTHTVSKHVGAILSKMRASSRTEAGVRSLRERLV